MFVKKIKLIVSSMVSVEMEFFSLVLFCFLIYFGFNIKIFLNSYLSQITHFELVYFIYKLLDYLVELILFEKIIYDVFL